MATYAIGDVQGCYDELRRLLDKLKFEPGRDTLWFTGDLVNRGPKSLETLRFVHDLGDHAITVLGNHDLHLIAAAMTGKRGKRDTLDDVLAAPDRDPLLMWLRMQPLMHWDQDLGLLVHAGLLPQWDLSQALALSAEASVLISGPDGEEFLRKGMYGNEPALWSDKLRGWDRARIIVNACTRLRYCDADGGISQDFKGAPGDQPEGLHPWFAMPGRKTRGVNILFGHWSMLGKVEWPEHHVYGLDTGCVWGGKLAALRLEDRKVFSAKSKGYSQIE
jgi:bis(5'-nucleosyl)-tetraphosphatase (symmetrical)